MPKYEQIADQDAASGADEVEREQRACAHREIRWAADGVSGWCKACDVEVAPPFRTPPPQSD